MDNFKFGNSYTFDEFVRMIEEEPKKWIKYLEIIILPDGIIRLARPSHQLALVHYAMDLERLSFEEIKKSIPLAYAPTEFLLDKYKCVSVWYNYYIRPENGFTKVQEEIIDLLIKRQLLSPYIISHITHEYELAVEREDFNGFSSIQPKATG